ncbi:hypothetical protein P8452_43487 [Trifolium repens]|nr:hypothetical protein P8452_43487 [Trifolium repens]
MTACKLGSMVILKLQVLMLSSWKAVTLMWKFDELICDIPLYQSSNNIHFSVLSISCLRLYCFKVKIHLFVNLDECCETDDLQITRK